MNDEQKFKAELRAFKNKVKFNNKPYLPLSPMIISAGCEQIKQDANAHWLFDFIIESQDHDKVKKLFFQIWILEQNKADKTWRLTCHGDSKKPPVLTKTYQYLDFPQSKLTIWVFERSAMLPSEY